MEKIIPLDSWGFDQEPAALIKVSSCGFTYHDSKDFLEKRASSEEFSETVKKAALKPGDIPIHVIAIGETERYGCNRNGDGFSRHTCKTAHHTFVSEARYYRHHKKGGVSKSFGYVKASTYNPEMGRIELLVIGNGTPEAARRNGGNVIPEKTLNQLADGDPVPWSMGCKLPHDVCAVCGHKAASPKVYCDEGDGLGDGCHDRVTGEPGLGCKHGLCKLNKNGQIQYVDNPNPVFHDISEVSRPADRTAYGWIADYLTKSAGIKSAEIAHVIYRDDIATDMSQGVPADIASLFRDLVSEEKTYPTKAYGLLKAAGITGHAQVLPFLDGYRKLLPTQRHERLMKLAEHGVLLTPENFFFVHSNSLFAKWPGRYAGYNSKKLAEKLAAEVACDLPGIYTKISESCWFPEIIRERIGMFRMEAGPGNGFGGNPSELKLIAKEACTGRNIRSWLGEEAVRRGTVPQAHDKTALLTATSGFTPQDRQAVLEAAIDYAVYKAAALLRVPEEDYDDAVTYAVRRNQPAFG